MGKLKKMAIALAGIIVFLALAGYVFVKTQMTHHKATGTPAAIEPSGDRILDAIRRGIEFLKVHQEPDGEFSAGMLDPKPAFTALVVDAIVHGPDRLNEETPFIARAVKAIISHQKENGGIYTPGLGLDNYSTSASIMALTGLKNPEHEQVIRRARDFVLGVQHTSGGMGYGSGGEADMSNTAMSLEALHEAGVPEDSDAFKRVAAFISRCQNSSESNPEVWAADDGGFIYRPGQSKAGTRTTADGKTEYISYGLMSYAGLVSFLWAKVDRGEERVKSAFRWVRENWTLEENKNIGNQGLYYYYLTMAKALSTYGVRTIETTDGKKHDWPVELSGKILSLQKKNGSWANENGRWYEDDPVLVTAYMIRALTICHEQLRGQ
jgi:squalene-hopene/tetraprenyl-beta-curcumene cyclase